MTQVGVYWRWKSRSLGIRGEFEDLSVVLVG